MNNKKLIIADLIFGLLAYILFFLVDWRLGVGLLCFDASSYFQLERKIDEHTQKERGLFANVIAERLYELKKEKYQGEVSDEEK